MSNKNVVFLYFVMQIFLPGPVLAADLLDNKEVIWKAGTNEFVKFTGQDSSSLGENDHPAILNEDDLSKALGSLKIPGNDRDSSDQEQQPVFTSEQIDVLSQSLVKGLARAEPDQDINFALEKSAKRFFGLKPNRYFVAGRAFYKDEKLNIIVGDYDRLADEGFEAAYDPTHVGITRYHFDHGRRTKSSKGFQTPIISAQGIENKQIQGTRRNDWIVIDLKQASVAVDMSAEQRKTEEQARKREEIRELLGSEQVIPDPADKTPPAAAPASIEERLKTLNRLKDQGLISDEEYASKRQQILDEL